VFAFSKAFFIVKQEKRINFSSSNNFGLLHGKVVVTNSYWKAFAV